MAHPLKDSHLFPLSRALHLLLINLSPVGDLVCHPLILLRLSQPLALLRLKEPAPNFLPAVTLGFDRYLRTDFDSWAKRFGFGMRPKG